MTLHEILDMDEGFVISGREIGSHIEAIFDDGRLDDATVEDLREFLADLGFDVEGDADDGSLLMSLVSGFDSCVLRLADADGFEALDEDEAGSMSALTLGEVDVWVEAR